MATGVVVNPNGVLNRTGMYVPECTRVPAVAGYHQSGTHTLLTGNLTYFLIRKVVSATRVLCIPSGTVPPGTGGLVLSLQ